MDEKYFIKVKNSRMYFIVGIVLLVWALGSTVFGVVYHSKYSKLSEIVESADGTDLVMHIEQQRETIITLHDTIDDLRIDLESAIGYGADLRDRNRRAIEIIVGADERLTDFENAVDSTGDLIERIERRQQRIDGLVAGFREDYRRLIHTLGSGNGEGF